MRSFDHDMPEERNRVVTDHLSDVLLCSTEVAVANLEREGITEGVELVGDVMADVALAMAPVARGALGALAARREPGRYLLVTAHRAGNVDDPEALRGSWRSCWRCRCPPSSRCTRARASGSPRRRAAARARSAASR